MNRKRYAAVLFLCEASSKLVEGIGTKSKKAVKHSIAFDGVLPCQSVTFTGSEYSSEDIALPVAIREHVKQANENNIYVFDRGLQSTRNMKGRKKTANMWK